MLLSNCCQCLANTAPCWLPLKCAVLLLSQSGNVKQYFKGFVWFVCVCACAHVCAPELAQGGRKRLTEGVFYHSSTVCLLDRLSTESLFSARLAAGSPRVFPSLTPRAGSIGSLSHTQTFSGCLELELRFPCVHSKGSCPHLSGPNNVFFVTCCSRESFLIPCLKICWTRIQT